MFYTVFLPRCAAAKVNADIAAAAIARALEADEFVPWPEGFSRESSRGIWDFMS